jgi:predicted Zn-dependent peptidase
MNKTGIKPPPEIITPSAGNTGFPEMTHLGNGIPVYLIGKGAVDLLRIEFVFNAGQMMERTHLAASMANAMLTEGTDLHDAMTLNDLIDRTGTIFNHTADKETASLVAVTLTRKLDEVMALAAEVLFRPSFPENEFRMLVDKRKQAFQISRQRTSVIAREEFYRALCGGGNPYGRITVIEDYNTLTAGTMREFHSLWYRPENMYITVAGHEPRKAIGVLEKYFGSYPCKWHRPEYPAIRFETAGPGRIFREVGNSVQSTVRLGWKGITRDHPDYHGLQVASTILGGYFGSRLMRNIREDKGYTYGIHSIAGSFHGMGFITIISEVAGQYRENALSEIRKEIKDLSMHEVPPEELMIVRNHIMGETARMFDGPFAVAETIRSIIDYDTDHDYFTQFVRTVETITPAEIKELFNTYFKIDDAFEIIAGTA